MRLSTLILLATALGCTPEPEHSTSASPTPQPEAGLSVQVGPDGASLQTSGKDGGVSVDVQTDTKKK